MIEHELKCWPEPYDAVAAGIKPFEWRFDDRGYAVGDVLVLKKWDPHGGAGGHGYWWCAPGANVGDPDCYPQQRVVVTYILRGQFGVPPGYVVMGIRPAEPQSTSQGKGHAK